MIRRVYDAGAETEHCGGQIAWTHWKSTEEAVSHQGNPRQETEKLIPPPIASEDDKWQPEEKPRQELTKTHETRPEPVDRKTYDEKREVNGTSRKESPHEGVED